MKVLCCVIPLLLSMNCVAGPEIQVGTVLFRSSDLSKKCWSDWDQMLLNARQVMQGVLPDPECLDFCNPGTITVILQYFQSCYDAVRESTCGMTQEIMCLALSDALGGYLKGYILPITRQAFYSGHVKYVEAKKVFQLYDEIKDYLNTNGAGWCKSRKIEMSCPIKPLKINFKDGSRACSQLIFKEMMEEDPNAYRTTECCLTSDRGPSEMNFVAPSATESIAETTVGGTVCKCAQQEAKLSKPKPNLKENSEGIRDREREDRKLLEKILGDGRTSNLMRNGKKIEIHVKKPGAEPNTVESLLNRTADVNSFFGNRTFLRGRNLVKRQGECCRATEEPQASCNVKMMIPLPMLDDCQCPCSIALPFREIPLRNLHSRNAVCVLVRYYITVVRCLASRNSGGDNSDIASFNGEFNSWLNSEVFPHLDDDEWYPAFGSVLRIPETMGALGSRDKCEGAENRENDFMFSRGAPLQDRSTSRCDLGGAGEQDRDKCQDEDYDVCMSVEQGSRIYVILGIVCLALIWLIAFCYCFICFCRPKCCNHEKVENQEPCSPKNSFIVQYLIRFFKKNNAEDERPLTKRVAPELWEDVKGSSEVELVSSRTILVPSKPVGEKGITGDADILNFEYGRRTGRGKEEIVMPAQLGPLEKDLGLNNLWPFTEFRRDGNSGKAGRSQPSVRHRLDSAKISRLKDEQFRTLYRRPRSVRHTSESLSDADRGNEHPRSGIYDGGRSSENMTSVSSYSHNTVSEEGHRHRKNFSRNHQTAFEYPVSHRYSYNTYNSCSSSQVEDDISPELYDHLAACLNSLPKTSLGRVAQRSESESGSDQTSTTSNSIQQSSLKRH